MEETEYSDLRPLFPPLFHVICLIYSNSNYYSSQARIIVILKVEFSALCFFSVDFIYCFKETCNLIIDYTKTYLDPSTIFQVEVKSTYLILCSHLFVFFLSYLFLISDADLQVEEALDKLKISLKTLKEFKERTFKYFAAQI